MDMVRDLGLEFGEDSAASLFRKSTQPFPNTPMLVKEVPPPPVRTFTYSPERKELRKCTFSLGGREPPKMGKRGTLESRYSPIHPQQLRKNLQLGVSGLPGVGMITTKETRL